MSAEETLHSSHIAALTKRMTSRDESAFADFHVAYAPRIFRYLLVCHRGNEQNAADSLQETLLRVVRHVRLFDDEAVFWDWLTRLARTAAADHGRKSSTYRRFLDRFSQHQKEVIPPDDERLAAAVDNALNQLSSAAATLLNAKYQLQHSQRDIAQQLGISEEAVESRLRRARAELKRLAFQYLRQTQP